MISAVIAVIVGAGASGRVTRRAGAFSVYREGMDREALKCAVQILVEAKRPLVLFPEGVVSRTNDHVNHLMDGTVFIARNAAKQRLTNGGTGKVVIHPTAIRYFFEGNLVAYYATPWLPDDGSGDSRQVLVTGYRLCIQGLVEMIQGNGVSVNKDKINLERKLSAADLLYDKYLVIQRGKDKHYLIIAN